MRVSKNGLSKSAKKIFKALETIEPVLPTPFYWMDAEGVVLGINDLCVQAIGTTKDIVGKKPYAFYKKEIAEHILKHNTEVIRQEKILAQEEWIEDIATKERKCFSSVKAPLYDDDGKVIGIVGTSIEITAQKEIELLKLEKERQQMDLLSEKEKLITLAQTVAHDISSPLTALSMMMHACDELHEDKRRVMNGAIASILDIANNLLSTYRNVEQPAASSKEKHQTLLVSDLLVQLLSEKKAQYSDRPFRLELNIAYDAQFAFAQMQPSQFRRSMSNLINNAVDALDGANNGIVKIQLTADTESIVVSIQDNGKGMSSNVIEKMLDRQSFTEGKKDGHGIGLQQVWDTVDNNQAEMIVDSVIGQGTVIQLTFPRIKAPNWIAHEIQPTSDGIVVILDDDESIHGAWDTRFATYVNLHPRLRSYHFTQGQHALDFLNALSGDEKNRVIFLSDYELLNQNKNGLQIIEASGIHNTTLVTSYYANQKIRDKATQLGIKILPKQMASIVPIEITEHCIATART